MAGQGASWACVVVLVSSAYLPWGVRVQGDQRSWVPQVLVARVDVAFGELLAGSPSWLAVNVVWDLAGGAARAFGPWL